MIWSGKIFVSAGCSFSKKIGPNNVPWNDYLANYCNPIKHISKGLGSAGNGFISRSVIYEVSKLLKDTNPKNIVVGIMWSGPIRQEFYWDNAEREHKWDDGIDNEWFKLPANFKENDNGSWIRLPSIWNTSDTYYKHFYDSTHGQITTLEHVLRTQWFLDKHNIQYFMLQYMDETFAKKDLPQCKHLTEQIDWTKFVTNIGCYEWVTNKDLRLIDETNHPTTEAHELFTNEVILPYLNAKN
jgi:hypothetical protein